MGKGKKPVKWDLEAESEYLQLIVDAMNVRSKAISTNCFSIDFSKHIEYETGSKFERLTIKIKTWDRYRIQFSIWDDRLISIFVGRSQKHGPWLVYANLKGRLLDGCTGPELVSYFEKTLSQATKLNPNKEKILTALWRPHISNALKLAKKYE